MKRLLRIFELSKNEQRVVLIVVFILIAIAFVKNQRRAYQFSTQYASAAEAKPSPTAVETVDDQ
jgi:hypothetical protein